MPYREKIAWLSLGAMIVAYGIYFTVVIGASLNNKPITDLTTLILFTEIVAIQVAILIVGHLYFRFKTPIDAKAKMDERDRAISQNSMSVAYYVLMAGIIMVGIVLPFLGTGWKIVNSALFMIVIAEFVQYSLVIWGYRKGA